MKTVKVLSGQSLWDIAVQEYGTVEAVFDLAMANGLGITDVLTAGQELVVPESEYVNHEIVAYYRKNGIRPVSGNIDETLLYLYEKFEEMKITFNWGNSDVDHPGMYKKVKVNGFNVKVYLLRIKLSDPDFYKKVRNPVLFIDRWRYKGNRTNDKTRLAGWKHPIRKEDWNGRIFEIPITSSEMVLDFNQEAFFNVGYDRPAKGLGRNPNFVDLAFRIRYERVGEIEDTGHLGYVRMYLVKSLNGEFIISYKLK